MSDCITASAPGKVVLWGEYAVLAGAPAAVLAIDRRAFCRIIRRRQGYRLSTLGFVSPVVESSTLQIDELPVSAALFAHAAAALERPLPDGLEISLDTSDFHRQQEKLGIGSSAAAMVACYGALCAITGETARLDRAIAAHQAFQGSGSGLDVAAAFAGGLIRYQQGQTLPLTLPTSLVLLFVFVGKGLATGRQLGSFSAWRKMGDLQALDALVAAVDPLFDFPLSQQSWRDYIQRLEALDNAAGLGIFSSEHRQLQQLARSLDLLYKPCGAGGGDIGMAIATNTQEEAALDRFRRESATLGFVPLQLTGTTHGLQVAR